MAFPTLSQGIVLLSGGMDSSVLAAFARRETDLSLLHVNYGQRTEGRELSSFHAVGDRLGVPASKRLVVDIAHLAKIGGSALTDASIEVPKANLDHDGIPVTYVPFRNAHFIAIAVSWAEVIGAKYIYVGAVEADSSGYPDCRPAFYDAMNETIRQGTKPDSGIEVRTPFIGLKKKDIILLGKSIGVPFEHTWSCYRDEAPACGVCDSCALRLRSFAEAGIDDPIPYAVRPKY